MTPVRVRFAPSPTGRLHIGGLRTALFNYLYAKTHKGTFVLRIEDTDQKRTVDGAVADIVRTLNAYGLVPDEGAYKPEELSLEHGSAGPYTQSKRRPMYQAAANTLLEQGSAYPCFCTAERLQQLRASQENQHLPPGYDGVCRALPTATAKQRMNQGEPHVIRFAMPKEGTITVEDLVRGKVQFARTTLEDSVLLKTDGYPTYHLANVVDDHAMKISHVIRAEEWLPSLPLHVQLYQAFGWEVPAFAHIPLILGPGRKKLSKRDGAMPAADYLKEYLPSAMINFIAFLGWNPKTEQEFYPSLETLVQDFNLSNIHKAGAIFDTEKLKHLNRLHMRALTPVALAHHAGLALSEAEAERYIPLAIDRATTLPEVAAAIHFLVADALTYDTATLIPNKGEAQATKNILQSLQAFWQTLENEWGNAETLKTATLAWIVKQELTNLNVLWPARVALTGQRHSPDVFDVAIALGKVRTVKRLEQGISKLKT
ncbi:MAG: glutamate--tRNA ligase [Patescibacteria group bacterium]